MKLLPIPALLSANVSTSATPRRRRPSLCQVRMLLAALCLIPFGAVRAQANAANYSFATTVTGSFTDMSSGTTQLIAADQDDVASAVTMIGFDFYFMGARQDRFSVNSNGSFQFGAATISTTLYDPLGQAGKALITAYGADQRSHAGDGKVHYKVTGSAPNRMLTVEWRNMQGDFNAGGTADLTYQVRLHETTGAIEFVYGSMNMSANGATDPNSQSPQFGFSSNNTVGTVGSITAAASGTPAPTFSGASAAPVNNLYVAGAIPVLSSAADGSRRTFLLSPPVVNPPGGALTFTNATATSETLNWTDSSNETGYAIYVSTDGTNFSFYNTAAQNATSFVATALTAGTTYTWRVNAVSEGDVAGISGSQPTLSPSPNVSLGTGLWSAPGTWSTGVVPTANDAVTISNGTTVTIDTAAVAYTVSVPGILQFEQTTARTLTVGTDVTVPSGGTFQSNPAGTQTGHNLSLAGNLTNNGTLDFSTNADTAGAIITFTGTNNTSFNGTGATTDIRQITVNKGTTTAPIVELMPSNFTVRGVTTDTVVGGWLVMTNGTIKVSGTFSGTSRVFATAGYTIPATAGFWLNNPNYTVAGQAGSATNSGLLRISQGTFNVGTATGNAMGFSTGSTTIVEGGAVNAAGRFGVAAASNVITYTQSGGVITVCTIGNTSATLSSFDLGTSTASTISMTAGTIVCQLSATAIDYRDQAAAAASVTGGTLQLGNAASGAAKTFNLRGALPNVEVTSTSAGHNGVMSTTLVNFNNTALNVTIDTGATFNTGNTSFFMAGTTLTNNGTLTANGSSSNFVWSDAGSAPPQTYTGTGVTTAPITLISLQNAGGLTLNSTNQVIVDRINLTTGSVTNANKLTIGNGGSTTGEVQVGSPAAPATPGGTFDAAPIFNLGSGGFIAAYQRITTSYTTGFELPPSRSLTNLIYADPDPTHTLTIAGGDVTATGTISLTNGRIITGANTLIAGSAATVTRTTGYVDGNFRKTFAAAASQTFEVGTANGYSPVTVNATAGTFPANFTAKTVQGSQPSLNASTSLQRYWTLTGTGLTADLTFSYLDPTDLPTSASESALVAAQVTGGVITDPSGATVNTSANTFTVPGATSFSDFTLALPPATITSVSPSFGPATGGTTVTITGTGFTGATAVKFGGVNAASFTVNSDGSITAVVPSGLSVGAVDISVTNSNGTSASSPADHFTTQQTFTVINTNDSGVGSLRLAITDADAANNNAAIVFDPTVFTAPRQTITVSGSLPNINTSMTITAPPAGVLVTSSTVVNGLFNINSGTVALSGLTIHSNDDGILGLGGTGIITGCTFVGPNANGFAAVEADGMIVRLVNSTITGWDLGVYTTNNTSVVNSTITGNRIGIANEASSIVTVSNSIVAGNQTDGATGTVDHSLTNMTAAAAGLDPNGLQEHGGLTQTIALVATSPAIDAGSNAKAVDPSGNPLTTDQRGPGFPREVNTTVDIGAFEYSPPPTVTINQAAGQADPTTTSPINFTVVFSEPVTGFDASDVALTGSTAGPTTVTVTETAPNDGTTYNVAVSGMTVSGTVIASIPANAARDAAGEGNTASTSTDHTVVYNIVVPSVTINQSAGQADPTTTSPINFTAVFSEPVTGFDASDVALTGSTAGPTAVTVTETAPNDGTTYNVAVSGMTGSGSVIASIPANAAQDAMSHGNTASTSTDHTVVYNIVVPSVTINQSAGQADPTTTSPVNFTVVFSEPVTGFDASDVALTGSAAPTAVTVTSIAPNDGTTYNAAVSGMTGSGSVLAFIPANAAQDAMGHGNTASTSTDNTVTYNIVVPSVTINQAAGQADPATTSPVNFTVVFSEPVTGFDASDVAITGSAAPTAVTVTPIAPNDGTTYNAAVSGMTGSGSVLAFIPANAAQDAMGHGNTASTSTDNTVTYTLVVPSVTINQAAGQADPTTSSPVNFTVVFSAPVTGFDATDVIHTGSAAPTTAVVTETAPNDGTTYNVAISGMTGSGSVLAFIPANAAIDAMGHGNTASTSTDNTVTYTLVVPSVTINQAAGQADPTTTSPINFTVVFSEPVTGFDATDVALTGSAVPTTAVVTQTAPNDGTTYNVAVSGMTGSGSVIASIPANAAQDAMSHGNTASTSTDHTVTFNNLPPTAVQVGTTATLNRQSGLFQITANVQNTTGAVINGFHLTVDYSAYLAAFPSLKLFNASSAPGATPVYVDYPFPVAAGATVAVMLDFQTSNRQFPNPFTPTLTVTTLTMAELPITNEIGTPVTKITKLADNTILLEWNSTATHWYRVSYSSDMVKWFDSPTPLQAGSNKMQWNDTGAPFTSISPADPSVTSRFYIVNEIATP